MDSSCNQALMFQLDYVLAELTDHSGAILVVQMQLVLVLH